MKKKKKNKRATTRTVGAPYKDMGGNVSWSHCSNKNCKDYSEMYRIPNSALSKRVCKTCKKYLKKAKIENGKPVMPVDGIYGIGQSVSYSDSIPEEQRWKKEKDGGDEPPILFFIIGFCVMAFIIFSVIGAIDKADPIDKAKEFFDDRSDKKEYCAERAEDASNSYAAKKIYKACMSNN